MANKKKPTPNLIQNRRARFDYELKETIWAGLALTGPEVRAARDGHVSLRGAYVTVKGNELWLTNSSFTLTSNTGDKQSVVDTSPRKLLVKKVELEKLIAAKDSGLTIVPTAMTNRTRYIKLEIATAKGKKLYDKRETIKRRDIDREHQRMIKHQ